MWGRITAFALAALLIAGAAWTLWPQPVSVETATIVRGPLTVAVEEEGISRIREVFRISAPVAGRLMRVTLQVGDPIAAGQTVASIRPSGPAMLDERSRRMAEAAQAAVSLAEANLAQAEAQERFATAEFARTAALAARSLVSIQTEQRAELEAASARESVAAARAALAMRSQELASARAALIEGTSADTAGTCCTNVEAPVDGVVLDVLTESEQVVQPGAPLLDVGNPSDLEVIVDVLSSDAVRIASGPRASIERWGGASIEATVERISPVAFTRVSALGIEEQRTRVILKLLGDVNDRTRLGHGFRVVARIAVWHQEDALTVPLGALFRRGDEWAVFAVLDGRARLRPIQLGQRNDAAAEVVAGLEIGDTVIVHPGDLIEDGHAVVTPNNP